MSEDKNNAVKDLTEGEPAKLILFFTLPHRSPAEIYSPGV